MIRTEWRTPVRIALELVATDLGIAAAARRLTRNGISILAYHNVVPPDDAGRGDTSLHLPLPRFIRQIERLLRTHEIVGLDDASAGRSGRRPRAIITFDDAYKGAVTLALPELSRRGLPATVFVSPALLGRPLTWWDALAELDLLSAERRHTALTRLAGRTDSILSESPDVTPPRLPDSYRIASLDELRRHCIGGIRVGSHAWAHEHLPSLDQHELTDSLRRTLAWLDTYDGQTSHWLALPYGAGSDMVTRTARELGHTGVLKIAGGLWRQHQDHDSVPRINVPAGMSWRGLELRAGGLLGHR